jgi:enoyl-CoA hydratase/carnithine racemase
MAVALDEAMNMLEDDPDLRVGVLAGTRTVFSAGTDMFDERDKRTPRGGEYGLIRRTRRKPLIAAVEGHAVGGGFEIVLSCDLVVAGATARFGLPETRRGLVATSGGLFRAPRVLPLNIAAELLLTGATLDAARGHALGLVNLVVDPGNAVDAAVGIGERICESGPAAVAESLQALRDIVGAGDTDGWARTERARTAVLASADPAEGVRAFAEKRDPRWTRPATPASVPQPGGAVRPQRRGRAIAMTPAEIDGFLAEQRTCRIATTSADGPHVAPLWFYWDGRSIWLNSLVRSQRWTDLQRDPRVAIVVDAGEAYAELRGVEIKGAVVPVGEAPRTGLPVSDLVEPETGFHRKYRNPEDAISYDGKHAWLRVTPHKLTSWDFRKMPK